VTSHWGLTRLTSIGGWIGDTLAQSVNHEQKSEAMVADVKKATVLTLGY
jgi:hypothetical protein